MVKIATIDLGFIQIEGLDLGEREYVIAVSQLARLFSIPSTNAARDLKTLLGGNSNYFKSVSSPLAKRKVKCVDIERLAEVGMKLSFKGNKQAQAFIQACLQETIERRFDAAFGNNVSETERDERLKIRTLSRVIRNEYTSTISKYCREKLGYEPYPKLFSNVTKTFNQRLFGVDNFNSNRDNMTTEQLVTAFASEKAICEKMKRSEGEKVEDIVVKTLDYIFR